jgi:holliday junction DNA helicase RuvA
MIEFVRGKVHSREPGRLVIDIGPLGLSVDVPQSVAMQAPPPGEAIVLQTQLLVREDALQLVGFSSDLQKRMFLSLTSVSGIGPKVALKVLGEIDPGELAGVIVRGDVARLTKLPGIGKKTAEVLVAHLRDAMGKSSKGSLAVALPASGGTTPSPRTASSDAILALQALGLDSNRAGNAVAKAVEALGDGAADTSRLVAEALKRL